MSKKVLYALDIPDYQSLIMLLPNYYQDNAGFDENVMYSQDQMYHGTIERFEIKREKDRPDYAKGKLNFHGASLGFTVFGRAGIENLKDCFYSRRTAAIFGKVKKLGEGNYWISGKAVDANLIGKVMPIYPASPHSEVTSSDVQEAVQTALKDYGLLEKAADKIISMTGWDNLSIAIPGDNPREKLIKFLNELHNPVSIERANRLMGLFKRLNAMTVASKLDATNIEKADCFNATTLENRLSVFPFQLTDEQQQVAKEISAKLNTGFGMRHMLVGDVGTGKTAVYASVVASAVDAGARSAILLPNLPLATQVFKEMSQWYPDIRMSLVTGETTDKSDLRSSQVIIGTTAILARDIGHINLSVVDEQQKYSREQREQMLSSRSHLLEVSATPIPRSVALVKHGALSISTLTQNHSGKTIHTDLRVGHDRTELMSDIRQAVGRDEKVFVIYPAKDDNEMELKSVKMDFAKWESMFPGKVRVLHGDMSGEQKESALADMKEGRANVLVSTTVVEVGVTVPNTTRLIIEHPERFGLVTLHQLRGRLVRNGGVGYCHLVSDEPLPDTADKRMRVFCETLDGMKLAEQDMILRGSGDVLGHGDQSGNTLGCMYNHKIEVGELARAAEFIATKKIQTLKSDDISLKML